MDKDLIGTWYPKLNPKAVWMERPIEPGWWFFDDLSEGNAALYFLRRRAGTDQLFTVVWRKINGEWVHNHYRHLDRYKGRWKRANFTPMQIELSGAGR